MKKTSKINNIKDLKHVNILGIKVLSTTTSSVLAAVEDYISHNKKFYILTPNPELILASTHNPELKEALNSADFAVPDGVGLKLANSSLNIIKGRELFMDLIKLAEKNKWKVFLLGGLNNEAKLTADKLKNENLKLKIEYAGGSQISPESKGIIDKINKFKPNLLFVAFSNPKQEIWIYKNLPKLDIGGAMAVGGTFRYIAGMSKLPPKFIETLGLEWLWRLLTEPVRYKRIWNAVVIFPWKVLLSKFS